MSRPHLAVGRLLAMFSIQVRALFYYNQDHEHLDSDDADELDRNAQLALNPTVSQTQNTSIVHDDTPRHGVFRVFLEVICVVAELGVHVAALEHGQPEESGRSAHIAAIAGVSSWAYLATLVLLRMMFTTVQNNLLPAIWYHTTFLYGCRWFFSILVLRSHIVHPQTSFLEGLKIADFLLVSILLLTSLTSRIGNKAVEIEYEMDIPPAKEPLASAFSLATFSWVDPIVWTGYKKTLELSDVWNLASYDKAAAVLADFRQLKKTSILAWHLLKYFRVLLLVQASWACFSGFLTFAPTLLLRAILQYVEDPAGTPKNSAWFFVILLFVSGAASALADGMALWTGRKVCIRLRAVIVGELYAKALRRKIGISGDKVLGEAAKEKQPEETLFKRILRFGRKKDTKPHSKNDASAKEPEAQVTSGAVINLMAVDSFKVADISAYLHFLWANTPVQMVVAILLLYQILGYSSIAGIGTMLLLLPVNLYISKKFAEVQTKILAATDARIHTTNEVLSNIRIIKYFAWERRFMNSVGEKRATELTNLRRRYILWAVAATIWGGAPVLITFLSFAVYTLVEKRDLIPSVAFTALSLFQILRIPLDQLADMVAHVQESKVSVDRIEEFLDEEDTQKYRQLKRHDVDSREPVIGFDKATFAWAGKNIPEEDAGSSFRMIDLDVRFAVGGMNVVVGPTGSGKSSMILALLGEMTLLDGQVHLPVGASREDALRNSTTGLTESVAYCAQQAWLVNDNIRQNIVFASPWNEKRYNEVIDACALRKDLEILDNGDDTLVGEKGVTLSGGQKARISLARALYSHARHVLLDDVISAVDSHSQKWIFEKALMGSLMTNRTCILVTNSVSLCLPQSKFAVVLDNGHVVASGSPDDIVASGTLHQDLTKSTAVSGLPSRVASATTLNEVEPEALARAIEDEPHLAQTNEASEGSTSSTANGSPDMNGHTNPNKMADKHDTPAAGPAKAVMTPSKSALDESKAQGSVQFRIIFMYFKSMGGWFFWVTAASAFVAHQVSNVSTNVWIRQWANAYATHEYSAANFQYGGHYSSMSGIQRVPMLWPMTPANVSNVDIGIASVEERPFVDDTYYLWVYALLGVVYMFITFAREMLLFIGSLSASKSIHNTLIERVCRAKFRFFDSTPLGQIMNRFSKDIENVDQEIAPTAVGVVHCLASIITIVILISVITPGFLIAGVFISVLYFLIGRFYINASRDLKRIESVQRSPLYQQFGETLSGMVTIRAYGDERRFIRDNLSKINTHNRPFIYLWAANRWLAFRVDIAGALVSFFAGVFVVLSVGKIDPGAAGLAMTYAVTFTENVLWFVRLYATNEQNMNSVERIKEYLDVEQEAPPYIEDKSPSRDWPAEGAVEFRKYSTRYRVDFEPVLRDINLDIKGGEKIGIVGRTGAGKSSMALALFRALEAEKGSIIVDGVNIGEIGLQDLRERIVMVPQDPTLFSGTVRSNLDPFELHTDEEVFDALRRVQLVSASDVAASRPGSAYPQSPRTPLINEPPTKPFGNTSASRPTTSGGTPTNRNPFTSLAYPIAESGSNLSQGQRQLLCLARALLKSPKILLMDEATASIDYATDSKIQETIRELKEKTIITIAHRLKTIVDYDRVVVLDRGQVVEVGEPWTLLDPASAAQEEDKSGKTKRWFREMCEMSGEVEVLEREAKRSFEEKRRAGEVEQ
ncbi:MAG: hypothetical protein Q9162_003950 [Coniocarpon cinnabarinum]